MSSLFSFLFFSFISFFLFVSFFLFNLFRPSLQLSFRKNINVKLCPWPTLQFKSTKRKRKEKREKRGKRGKRANLPQEIYCKLRMVPVPQNVTAVFDRTFKTKEKGKKRRTTSFSLFRISIKSSIKTNFRIVIKNEH